MPAMQATPRGYVRKKSPPANSRGRTPAWWTLLITRLADSFFSEAFAVPEQRERSPAMYPAKELHFVPPDAPSNHHPDNAELGQHADGEGEQADAGDDHDQSADAEPG